MKTYLRDDTANLFLSLKANISGIYKIERSNLPESNPFRKTNAQNTFTFQLNHHSGAKRKTASPVQPQERKGEESCREFPGPKKKKVMFCLFCLYLEPGLQTLEIPMGKTRETTGTIMPLYAWGAEGGFQDEMYSGCKRTKSNSELMLIPAMLVDQVVQPLLVEPN